MGAFQQIVDEIERMQKAHPPPSSVCDNPQYSPNHVLEIVKAVREEAIWSEPEEWEVEE